MLSNLTAVQLPGIGQSPNRLAFRIYSASRKRWLKHCQDKIYIEINPFLSNIMTDIVESDMAPEGILHIVRHPVTWVTSMIQFGAYSWRRPLVPYLPYVYYRPPYGTKGWNKLSFAQKLAHEWNYRNDQILAASVDSRNYARIRYEDLFQAKDLNEALLTKTIRDLGFVLNDLDDLEFPDAPANASQTRVGIQQVSQEELAYIERVTKTLSNRFGYV